MLLLLFTRLQLAGAAHESGAALQVSSVDLSIAKVATPDLVAAGEQVTYTLTISNAGTLSATNVIVSDSLPSGVTLATWSTDAEGVTCDDSGVPVVCMLGDLDAGASLLISLVADVNPETIGVLVNNAEVSSDVGEVDVSNNIASASVSTFASADLSLTKSAHANLVLAGQPVTYTLTISNAGPSAATGVTVIDELPKQTKYVSGDGALCSRQGRTVECLLSDLLQARASAIITLVFDINADVTGPLTNNAEVSSDAEDNSTGNNMASATVTVTGQADLSLIKTASTSSVFAGDRLTYTLSVSNVGPSDALNVVISDTLPPGTSLVSASGASCSELNNVLDCSIPDPIAADAGAVVSVVVNVDATEAVTLTNFAEVSSDEIDDSLLNNRDSVVVTVNPKADLSLVKTASSSDIFAGDRLTYTLAISNAGPSVAQGVIISDTLPPGTSYVSASGASCSELNNVLDCSIPGPIAASGDAVASVIVDVDATAAGTLTNFAEVSSDVFDDALANNRDSVLVTINAEADLSLIKTASSDSVFAGDRLTYTLAVNNAGPSVAENAIISDTLPPGTSFVSVSGASCSELNSLLDCSIPDPIVADAGAVVSVVVNVDATEAGTLTNFAEVSSDAIDKSPTNNRDSVVVTVSPKADLSLAKMASTSNVLAGDRLTYTLAINNAGPSEAQNVVISDTLPPGTSFVSASGASCSELNNVLDCSISDPIAAGGDAAVSVLVEVDATATGTLTNFAEVSSDVFDDALANNTDSVLVIVTPKADLSLVKTASSDNVFAGDRLTYTLAVNNTGPSVAQNVVVSDTLPPGGSFVSASGAFCLDDDNLLTCSLPSPISAGAGAAVTLVVDIDANAAGMLTNFAEVSSDALDDSLANNLDSVLVIVKPKADLSLVKTASSDNVFAGDRLTYTLAIDNAGPSVAKSVVISDTLPPGTSFASASGAFCFDDDNLLTCSLPSPISAGTDAAVTLVVDIDATEAVTLTNFAEVSSDAFDDSLANNRDSALVLVDPKADLSLVKTASSSKVLAGGRLTYTLEVNNAGPSVAQGVIISDTLPPGTSFVSANGAFCFDDDNILTCSLPGPISAGDDADVTLVVDVDAIATGTLTNHAEVNSITFDNALANNPDSVLVTVNAEADLSLIKTASSDNVFAGDRLTYTLAISNAGPSDAFNVVISDTLPTGTSFVSAQGAFCFDDDNLITCSLPGPIADGAESTVTLVVDVDSAAPGTLTNTAEVDSDAVDRFTGANLDSASTVVHHRLYMPFMLNGPPTGEPNNTCEQAFAISVNRDHWFLPEDIFDWYEFELSISGNLTVELSDFTPIRGQVAAYKSDDCDNRKEGFLGNVGDPGATKILDLGLQDPGHYYVFVGSDGALSETNPYRLRISVEPAGP